MVGLTLGKFHNAAQNHSGGIRDIGYWYSSGDAPTNTGNTVSYAFSSDAASFQLDAIMDGGIDTGKSIDQVQFGMSVNLGDIGKVALGYVEVEDTLMPAGMTGDDDSPNQDPDPVVTPEPKDPEPGTMYAANTVEVNINGIQEIGDLQVWTVVTSTTVGSTISEETKHLYRTPGTPTNKIVSTDDKSVLVTPTGKATNVVDGPEPDAGPADDTIYLQGNSKVTITVKREPAGMSFFDTTTGGTIIKKADISKVTHTRKPATGPAETTTYYEVHADPDYYRFDPETGLLINEDGGTFVDLSGSKVTIATDEEPMRVKVESEMDEETPTETPEMAEETPEETPDPMVKVDDPEDFGYTSTHVSVQLNLGAVTLGLGYSEKESNAKGSMDEKTTYVGASGSIGDTGMGWRAWTRDISNSGNKKGDRNPWGIGINKDLGGGAFTFVEHHNADKGASGNTIVALGVNF